MTRKANKDNLIVFLLAGGTSSRFSDSGQPKLLTKLAGKEVILHALESFIGLDRLGELVVLFNESWHDQLKDLLANYSSSNITLVPGGTSRQASVRAGLDYLKSTATDLSQVYIAVHDAARCSVGKQLVSKVVNAAYEYEAVTLAIPLTDSISKVSNDYYLEQRVARESLWRVQTPQVFRGDLLLRGHEEVIDSATDDATLVQAFHPVKLIEGSEANMKLTYQSEVNLFEKLLTAG